MKEKALRLLVAVGVFALGAYVGAQHKRQEAAYMVAVSQAKADAYMLAALETAKACPQPKGGWFKP